MPGWDRPPRSCSTWLGSVLAAAFWTWPPAPVSRPSRPPSGWARRATFWPPTSPRIFSSSAPPTGENNKFFSVPVSIIRRRANLGPPLPGQPGPFSLGAPGVLEEQFRRAGFHDVKSQTLSAPLKLATSDECLQFEKESFGALHQMLGGLDAAGQQAAWSEIGAELRKFQGPSGFEGPCEMEIAVGTKFE